MRIIDENTGIELTDYELRVVYGNVSLPDPVTEESLDIANISNNTQFRIPHYSPSILQAEATQRKAESMKVFIVEDSATMLNDLRSMLSAIPGVAIIGHAVDEAGAIERINALRPDVVTLDLQLETGSGFDVLKSIKKHHFRTKVVVLTNCTSEVHAKYCMRVGADHFFDKSLQFLQFCEVLREWAHHISCRLTMK